MGAPSSQRPPAALPWLPAALRPAGLALTVAGGALGYAVLARGFRPRLLDVKMFALHARYFESKSFQVIEKNVTLEMAALLLFGGLFFMAFARDRVETEETERIRLWALAWATCLGAALLLVATLTLFGLGFAYALGAHAVVTLALASALAAASRARTALARRRGATP